MNIVKYDSANVSTYCFPFLQKNLTSLSCRISPYFRYSSTAIAHLWQGNFLLEENTPLHSFLGEKRSFSIISNEAMRPSIEQNPSVESANPLGKEANPLAGEGASRWKKITIAVLLAGLVISLGIYLVREGKDPVEELEKPSEEVLKTREFVKNFNTKMQGSGIADKQKYYEEALIFLQEIKRWGGLAQSSHTSTDIPTARLCFIEMLQCKNEPVRLQAIEYLTKLLQIGTNPYAEFTEILALERILGQTLEHDNILNTSPPVLEQTIKAYTLVLEHMRVYLAKGQGAMPFRNKTEILKRTKNVSTKLESPQFQYYARSIDNLASNLNVQPRPVQNSINSSLDFLEQVQKPGGDLYEFFNTNVGIANGFFALFFGESKNPQAWLQTHDALFKENLKDVDINRLRKLVSDITEVGEATVSYFDKMKLALGISSDKKSTMHEKILLSKSIWTCLPHSQDSIKGVSEIVNAECQSKDDWELLYGAVELFGEVILSSKEKPAVKEEALKSIFALLDHPHLVPVVSYKIGELFILLNDTDNDLLQQQAEAKNIHFNLNLKEVKESLAWFKEVQSAKQKIYKEVHDLHLKLYSKGALNLLPSDEMYTQLSNSLPANSKYFIERSTPLEKVSAEFRSKQNTVCIQVIHGLGGTGKTQLAIQYARLNVLEYRFVHWIKSESLELLKADLSHLADILIPDQGNGEEKLTFLKSWLENEKNSGWLLVFDNVDKIKDSNFLSEFKKHLPTKGGHVLITSTITDQQPWGGLSDFTSFYPLEVFSLHQSTQYLQHALPLLINDDSAGDAKLVADAMGKLPLGLAQAAGFLRNHPHINLRGFLKRFEEQETLLDKNFLAEYPKGLAAAWAMNMAEVKKNTHADTLLTLCAFLSREEIPIDFLNQWIWYHESQKQTNATHPSLDSAIKTLCDYSMVNSHSQSDKELISMHRLVQKMVRQASEKEISSITLKEAIDQMVRVPSVTRYNPRYADTLFPFRSMLPHCESLLQHANVLIQPVDTNPIPFVQLALIVNRYFTETERNLPKAAKYLKLAKDWIEKVDHPFKGKVHLAEGVIALKKRDKVNHGKALEHFENARLLFELYKNEAEYADLEENPIKCNRAYQLAISLLYQAEAFIALADYEKAKGLLDDAKSEFISFSENGEHFDIARILRDQGTILQKEGDFPHAKQKILEAIEMQRHVYGETFNSEPTVAATFSALGDVCQDLQEYEEANKAYEKVIDVNRVVYKTELHEYIARVYGKREKVFEKLNNFEKANAMKKKQEDILGLLKSMGR